MDPTPKQNEMPGGMPFGVNYRVRRDAATPMHLTAITTDKDRFRLATADFGLRLFKSLKKPINENVLVSPCLVEFPLLPLLAIADGETKNEIKKVLGMEDIADDVLHSLFQYGYYRLNQNGRRHDQWRPHGIKIWDLHPVYLLLMKQSLVPTGDKWSDGRARVFKCYQNVLHGVRFLKHFQDFELKAINRFIARDTKNEFGAAIPEDKLNLPGQNIAMVSAINYSGTFVNGFRVDTESSESFVMTDDDDEVPCQFLRNETLKEYTETDECQVLGLEYVWGSLTYYIFLPKPGVKLETFEADLTAKKLTDLMKAAATDRVHKKYLVKYMVPTFTLTQSHDLSEIFREKLGLQSLFDQQRINLRTFQTQDVEAPSAMGSVSHCVSLMVSKDPRGELNRFARPLRESLDTIRHEQKAEFNADRPFFFVVYDNRAQVFLFMGRLANPSKNS